SSSDRSRSRSRSSRSRSRSASSGSSRRSRRSSRSRDRRRRSGSRRSKERSGRQVIRLDDRVAGSSPVPRRPTPAVQAYDAYEADVPAIHAPSFHAWPTYAVLPRGSNDVSCSFPPVFSPSASRRTE
ncbi:unnamed protein product, partial [Nesidiocoris tenuis]